MPLTCLGAAWFLNGVKSPAFDWKEVMEWLNVREYARYTRLVVLALGLIAIVAVLRVIGGSKR